MLQRITIVFPINDHCTFRFNRLSMRVMGGARGGGAGAKRGKLLVKLDVSFIRNYTQFWNRIFCTVYIRLSRT